VERDRLLWLDVSAGAAGDMILAALLDAGAPLDDVRAAVEAVLPGTVALTTATTTRAGLRATALTVTPLVPDQPHRRWTDVRALLLAAPLDDAVRAAALATFAALAEAEARVHGIASDDVAFHEVGAWDAIADVVGVCAAIPLLGVTRVVASELALGSGTVRAGHGVLPVPVPAVLELGAGLAVVAGGAGELATPTGVALVRTLAVEQGVPLPAMTVRGTGVGAGSRDVPGRANVVRAVVGTPRPAARREVGGGSDGHGIGDPERMVLVETTVDDLDPRVWPLVLDELLAAGAADVWLTPVLMKKGRPGHVLTAVVAPPLAAGARRVLLERTSTLGVRTSAVEREVLDRAWVDVELPGDGGRVRVKVAGRAGRVLHATPEFEDAAALAAATGRGVREVLEQAVAAATIAGLVAGAAMPGAARG